MTDETPTAKRRRRAIQLDMCAAASMTERYLGVAMRSPNAYEALRRFARTPFDVAEPFELTVRSRPRRFAS